MSTLKAMLLAKANESGATAQSQTETNAAAEMSEAKPVGLKSIPTPAPKVIKVSKAERMQRALKMLRTEVRMLGSLQGDLVAHSSCFH